MRTDRPIATLQHKFPLELQTNRAAFELKLDDNSKLLFIPLQSKNIAIQCWRPGQARDGHGYLLAGSAMLSEADADQLIDSIVLRKRVA
jgi:hypothetical protein